MTRYYRRPYYNATPSERFRIEMKRCLRRSIHPAIELFGNLVSTAAVVFAIMFLIPIMAACFR